MDNRMRNDFTERVKPALQIEEIERKIKKAKNGIIDCEAKLLKIEKGEHIKN